jgi:hypothetical protein
VAWVGHQARGRRVPRDTELSSSRPARQGANGRVCRPAPMTSVTRGRIRAPKTPFGEVVEEADCDVSACCGWQLAPTSGKRFGYRNSARSRRPLGPRCRRPSCTPGRPGRYRSRLRQPGPRHRTFLPLGLQPLHQMVPRPRAQRPARRARDGVPLPHGSLLSISSTHVESVHGGHLRCAPTQRSAEPDDHSGRTRGHEGHPT